MVKAAAVCGIAGPILFAVAVAALSFLERDFMLTLGWDPLTAPTRDWPSGLALGPGGFAMTAAFLLCGLLLVSFGMGLRWRFRTAPVGSAASIFLALAGFAMCFLAFPTDPTNILAPVTLHGRVHDGAFAVMGAALLASLVCFGLAFHGSRRLAFSVFSWVTAALIVPSFTVKGIVFYLFLAVFLAWCEAAAVHLLRSAGITSGSPA